MTLAGTPGVELTCPPKFVEVTEDGVPLIWAMAGLSKKRATMLSSTAGAATVAEFGSSTQESYSCFSTMAHPRKNYYLLVRTSRSYPRCALFPALPEKQGALSSLM